jgi:hypothetical protein
MKTKKLTLKTCGRKKFTEKELEILEKCHWLHHKSMTGSLLYDFDGALDLHSSLHDKADSILY